MTSEICYDIKKNVITSKIASWLQKYVMTSKNTLWGGGGDTYRGAHIPYPRFFTPNIPYPRFCTSQYPISQIVYPPISYIPDFTVNWPYPRFCKIRMCMYTFIWHTIGENGSNFVGYICYCCQYTCAWALIWNCILTMYTIQICTWGVNKMHSIIQTLNFTNHRWKITELKICCMLLVFTLHLTK